MAILSDAQPSVSLSRPCQISLCPNCCHDCSIDLPRWEGRLVSSVSYPAPPPTLLAPLFLQFIPSFDRPFPAAPSLPYLSHVSFTVFSPSIPPFSLLRCRLLFVLACDTNWKIAWGIPLGHNLTTIFLTNQGPLLCDWIGKYSFPVNHRCARRNTYKEQANPERKGEERVGIIFWLFSFKILLSTALSCSH